VTALTGDHLSGPEHRRALEGGGEIARRSWYNRAGVEPVMGFCTPEETERFLGLVPAWEKAMTDSGIVLLKYWLEVSPDPAWVIRPG
jgi:polyphosphate kinase 2 (PPK2 family)